MTMTSRILSVVRPRAGLIAIVMVSLLDKKVAASGSVLRCPMLPSDGRHGAAAEVGGVSHAARYPIDAALRARLAVRGPTPLTATTAPAAKAYPPSREHALGERSGPSP